MRMKPQDFKIHAYNFLVELVTPYNYMTIDKNLLFFCSAWFLSDVSKVTLWSKFFDADVYITPRPDEAFHCVEPGWFRIAFPEQPSLL